MIVRTERGRVISRQRPEDQPVRNDRYPGGVEGERAAREGGADGDKGCRVRGSARIECLVLLENW